MKTKYFLCIPVAFLVVSCAQPSLTGDTYQRGDVGQAETVNTGKVTSIEPVKIEGGTGAGTLIGGLAGGLLGSNIGSGRAANTAGAVGGALVGGAVGSHAEQAMGSKHGIRIGVRLDRGGSIAVVQEVNPREEFYVGDRVRVLGSGNSTRVTH
jgi:outer membrane lipoprotein SlyB